MDIRTAFPLTCLVLACLNGCTSGTQAIPRLRHYDFAYRVRWFGRHARKNKETEVFSSRRRTYFIIPDANRSVRAYAQTGSRLHEIPLQYSSPYLIADCLSHHWLLIAGRVGYANITFPKRNVTHTCVSSSHSESEQSELFASPIRTPSVPTSIETRWESAYRRAVVVSRTAPQNERQRTQILSRIEILGRACRPRMIAGHGHSLSVINTPGCLPTRVFAARPSHLQPLAFTLRHDDTFVIHHVVLPIIIAYGRVLTALTEPREVENPALRRFLNHVGKASERWHIHASVRHTLQAWCRREGCRTSGAIPSWNLAPKTYYGTFISALKQLLHHLGRRGLVLDLKYDPARKRLFVRTLWYRRSW